MAAQDYHMDSPEEYEYPDIEEAQHYSWQATHTGVPGEISSAVIDPRLFGDDVATDIMAQSLARPDYENQGVDEFYPDIREVTPDLDADASDEEFALSENESARYDLCIQGHMKILLS